MRLGIDFGTTRTIVAAVDRGNYPLVTFDTPNGFGCEWFPGVIATRRGELKCGFEALDLKPEDGWLIHRSIKRRLAVASPSDLIEGFTVRSVMVAFLSSLKTALISQSNLSIHPDEPLEVAIAVPAQATANQRLLTADAFQDAGFEVIRMLDEPSAAGLEYAWRRPADAKVRKRLLAVYDFGGGTFDASFIELNEDVHEVITTEGVYDLGGDDFDEALLSLSGVEFDEKERQHHLETCRLEKEKFNPSTRKLRPEIGPEGVAVEIPVEDFEQAIQPLIQRSIDALNVAIGRAEPHFGVEMHKHTVVYQVGGTSMLPTVGRMLREQFGRRVWRSPYPHGSIAIGLAIMAESENTPRVKAKFTRNFGVWREGDCGQEATFDSIFPKDTPIPEPGQPEVYVSRRYRAMHNIAHFRFVESSALSEQKTPRGEITPWQEVKFPLISDLRGCDLDHTPVERLPYESDEIEEYYSCDKNGVIRVEIRNLSAGYAERFTLHGREQDLTPVPV